MPSASSDLDTADLGAWTCAITDDRHVTCTLDRLAAGATAGLVLPAKASAVTTDRATLTVVAGNRPDVTVSSDTPINATSAGLSERGHWSDGYGVTEIGAPALTCDTAAPACESALKDVGGNGQNNNFSMVPLTESGAELKVPDGSTIEFAGLYWSGNRAPGDQWTGPLTTVQLQAPGSDAYTDVDGAVIAETQDLSSRSYYQSFADVTGLVTSEGRVSVRGVATAQGRTDGNKTYYGGWSLVVVYTAPGTHQDVTVYDGGAWIATGSSTTFDFASDGDRTARFGVVAWDGDRGVTGDRLSLDGDALVPVRWDGKPGSADDAFTSTAMGSDWANTLGVDAKPFVPVEMAEGLHRLTASTASDQYLIGAVTVTTSPR